MKYCTCGRCYVCTVVASNPNYQALWADQERGQTTRANPPVREMTAADLAKRFLQALTRETAWRAAGGRGPTSEEKAERRAICNACDQRDPKEDRCLACGCWLEAHLLHLPPIPFGKLDAATQICPLHKWSTVAGAPKAGCG